MITAKRYIITTSIGIVMFLIVALSRDLFMQDNKENFYRVLCDAFFFPGALIGGFGVLVIASNGGTFDMLTFGIRTVFNLFNPSKNNKKKTFAEYKIEKHSYAPKYGYLLIIGLFYIFLALISYFVFWQYHNK